MILLLFRAVWPVARPIVLAAAIGVVCLIVLGFNPLGIAKEWLINQGMMTWDWLTCEVAGWC